MEKEAKSGLPSAKSDIDPAILLRALDREKNAKRAAEKIIEEKSTELYFANKELAALNESLEKQVVERTTQLKEALTRAEESAKAKETFLANMSHEIRTPMNSIIGFVNLLLKKPWPEKEMSYLSAIKSSSNNLLVLINDILDLSKISSGNLRLESIEFSLSKLVRETIYNFHERAVSKGIGLHNMIDPDLSDQVIGDPVRIQQILNNIIGNAIKFTEDGAVSVAVKLLANERNSQTVEFRISDTGIGISPDKTEAIFESFIQEDDSTTRQYGGTGLGLAICKQLIELFKGDIKVDSRKGTGTTFTIHLPLRKAKTMIKKQETENDDHVANRFVGAEVLVVEDNEFNQMLIENILNDNEYVVDIVGNGQLAVEKVRQKSYDIVLMDIQMPVMGGVEATKIIREQLGSDLPIIALTANALKGDEEKYKSQGMDDYVSKPFEEADLVAKMNNLISRNRQGFDLSNIKKIARGDSDFVASLLDQFIKDISATLTALRDCRQGGGVAEIKQLVHSMKSSIKILEISQLEEIVRQIELWPEDAEDDEELYDFVREFDVKANDILTRIRSERNTLV